MDQATKVETQTQVPEDNQDLDLSDMLQELRILLQGAQVLTAFLIILHFNQMFATIDGIEKGIYVVTFLCSLISLIFLAAPAAHHRLARPLMDQVRFKNYASKMIVIGLVPLSLALVLSSLLVLTQVAGITTGLISAIVVAVLLISIWWIFPLAHRQKF